MKALGTGLSVPQDRFQVTVRADQPARLMSVDWDESGRWTLVDEGEPGIAATLAVEAHSPIVRRFKFTPPSA